MAKTKSYTCFVCYFKPSLIFGSIGVTPLSCSCPHSSNTQNVTFRRSTFLASMSALTCILVILTSVDIVRDFLNSDLSPVESLMMTNDIVLCFCGAIMVFTSFLMIVQKAVELQGLAEIIHDAEKRGIVFLDQKFVRANTIMTYAGIVGVIILEAATITRFVLEGNFDIPAVRTLISDTMYLLQGTIVVHFHNVMSVFIHLWERVFMQIKYGLKKNFAEDEESIDQFECVIDQFEEKECHDYASDKTLGEQLKELHRMCSSIFISYTEVHNFMSPTFVIWWTTVTISVTIKHVIMVKCIQYQITFGMPFIIRTLKCYVDLTTTAIFFHLVERIANVVSYNFCIINVFLSTPRMIALVCTMSRSTAR